MRVVGHELGAWHLFVRGEELYLDLRTGRRGHGFWLLLKLEPWEVRSYRAVGAAFVRSFIADILRGAVSCLGRGGVPDDTRAAALDALTAWRRSPAWPQF